MNGGKNIPGRSPAGVLNGDLRLIGNDGGTIISHDAGSLQDIAPLIANDGGTFVAGGGGNFVAGGGGNLVPGGGGNSPGGRAASGRVRLAGGGPAFTGVMTVNGNYAQEAGTGLAGTIGFALFDPSDVTSRVNLFQPPVGAIFDVVVASNIFTHELIVRGPIWGDGLHFNWGVVSRADGKQAVRLVVVPIVPALIFQALGGKVEVAYPTNFAGYTLQRSPAVALPTWTAYSTATNRIAIDTTEAAGFFRLFKP